MSKRGFSSSPLHSITKQTPHPPKKERGKGREKKARGGGKNPFSLGVPRGLAAHAALRPSSSSSSSALLLLRRRQRPARAPRHGPGHLEHAEDAQHGHGDGAGGCFFAGRGEALEGREKEREGRAFFRSEGRRKGEVKRGEHRNQKKGEATPTNPSLSPPIPIAATVTPAEGGGGGGSLLLGEKPSSSSEVKELPSSLPPLAAAAAKARRCCSRLPLSALASSALLLPPAAISPRSESRAASRRSAAMFFSFLVEVEGKEARRNRKKKNV